MSQPPLDYSTPQFYHRAGPQNTVGLIGFIFVMVGLVGFCFAPLFVLGLIGTVLCAIGVFRQPRALALAGLIVGGLEMLVALVVVVFLGIIIGAGVQAANEAAKMSVSSNNARDIGWAIDRYKAGHNALPATLADVPDLGDVNDGWGNPIRYVPNMTTGKYQLVGNGRDGKPDTADDMKLADTSITPYSTTTIPTMAPARAPKKPTPPDPAPPGE